MTLIKDPKLDNPAIIARLAPIPAKIEQIQRQMSQLENETQRIEDLLLRFSEPAPPPSGGANPARNNNGHKGVRQNIRIEIDWSRLGKSNGKEVIFEHLASDSLAKLVTRLYELMGIGALEKLSKLRINRGPFVTRNPNVDYWNESDQKT